MNNSNNFKPTNQFEQYVKDNFDIAKIERKAIIDINKRQNGNIANNLKLIQANTERINKNEVSIAKLVGKIVGAASVATILINVLIQIFK